MTDADRVERRLRQAIDRASSADCPPKLAEALHYAVFPGGGRVRPLLTMATASALGQADEELAERAAAAVELIHCASLVHDDMPCFDDAELRRGRPALHRAFGEEIALLVGDALIALAFEEAGGGLDRPLRTARLIRALARGIGPAHGIIGGQAWESEDRIDLERYHRAKTGALFEAAAVMGAVAAGADGEPWRRVGQLIGEAYQIADDLADAAGDAASLGKATGQDASNGAPNAVDRLGLVEAARRLEHRIAAAQQAVPQCDGCADLKQLIGALGRRLCPSWLRRHLAGESGAEAAA